MKITPPETGSQPSLGATGIGGSTAVPDAADIPIAGGYYGAGTVEEALAAIAAELARLAGTGETRYWPMLALTSGPTTPTGAHVSDTTDAHDASAVSFIPTAGIAATDVQAAIVEDAGDLTTHAAAADPHGVYVLKAATSTTLGNDAGATPTTLILAGGTAGVEGGELQLMGAGANTDWSFDNLSGRLRWYSGANVYMDLSTTRLLVTSGDKIVLGSAEDTNLYRSAANILKTDDRFDAAGGLNGLTVHAPVESGPLATDKSTTSTSFVDIGAPFDQSVVAPPSGRVLILAVLDLNDPNPTSFADATIAYQLDAGSDVVIGAHAFDANNPGRMSVTCFDIITGLTPGQSYAVSLRWKTTSGTLAITGATRGGAGNGSRMLLLPLA